jgi:hypothetical protein
MTQVSFSGERSEQRELEQQIARLETQIADLQRRLPAHSIPPAMLAALDELDEQLAEAQERLAQVTQAHKDEDVSTNKRAG